MYGFWELKKMKKKLILWIVWILLFIHITLALKPAPASFYGYVAIEKGYAAKGSVIEVYDSSNTLCGNFVIQNEGRYGLLICEGDDPVTKQDEGAVLGENITFYINGFRAKALGNTLWQSGVLKQVDIALGNVTHIEPYEESPSKVTSKSYRMFIRIMSLIGSIILITIFLWLYNKK